MFKTCHPRGVRFWPEHGFRHGLRFFGVCGPCLNVLAHPFFECVFSWIQRNHYCTKEYIVELQDIGCLVKNPVFSKRRPSCPHLHTGATVVVSAAEVGREKQAVSTYLPAWRAR